MILPTKHIRSDRALLAIGADVLAALREPVTVSRLWDEIRIARGSHTSLAPVNYDWFILALDLLYIIGAVELDRGLLRRSST